VVWGRGGHQSLSLEVPKGLLMELVISGWKYGLQTISLIRVVRTNSGMGLLEAKQAVEGLLDGKEICLSGLSEDRALALRQEIEALNAICR
jgi:ribosomal protein L7/L12